MRLELNGTKASLAFDFEDMNALSFYDAADRPTPASAGFSSPNPSTPTSATGGPPAMVSATSTASPTRWWTSSTRLPRARSRNPSFADALQVQRVLAAVEASAANSSQWQKV